MQTFLKGKRVGYWLSEKKIRKLNFQAFAELCRKRGVEVVQLVMKETAAELCVRVMWFSAGYAKSNGGPTTVNKWIEIVIGYLWA
ncbi:hypothetical protein WISP_115709 [Willisornis vidua]|uniref:Inositol-tetrakisphosphate 1-kinase N-terminal domain-containing protein n=1 Tax=Willisornis vidua TaxID=1566151 RepID=A0ABQ9CX25_9PASS|nr:hypothetical protein WISP_115709 [Willisornis vidua]